MKRARFFGGWMASASTLFLFTQITPAADGPQLLVYLGTYTSARSQGIYVCRLDQASGALTAPSLAAETKNPSFLAVHPNQRFLYAVSEFGGGSKEGAVTTYAIRPDSGKLTRLNQQSTRGSGPCHLVVDRTGRQVLVANYGSGSLACLPLKADGMLGEATAFIQHQGASVNRQRQQGPHAHGITLDAANRFVFVPDLGLDKILCYRFDAAQGSLIANDPPFTATLPGAGPRHFAFHPSGRFAYVINELSSTVNAYAYDATRGELKEIQSVSTLPEGFTGSSSTAEIEVHPSGKFLYGSNRGHDSLAVFAIEAGTGKLTFVAHQPTRGKTPRNFGIEPAGRWLLAANQGTDNVVVFRIEPQTGRLTATEHAVTVGAPVCVMFVGVPAGP